jgi:FMN phosphatase YigB (HAD superfamily)
MNTIYRSISQKFLPDRDVLFIDIDDTITRFRDKAPQEGQGAFLGQTILWLMCKEAERNGKTFEEAQRIVRHVFDSIRWWDWADFLCALGLDPNRFWQLALEVEQQYLVPVCPQLPKYFDQFKAAGFKMFITSNNTSSGSLHKLRLLGRGEVWHSPWFLRCFGPPEMHRMKREPEFWQQVLCHTGIDPNRITVIGDLPIDDVESPRKAGIHSAIRIDWQHTGEPVLSDGAWIVSGWEQIVELLGVANAPLLEKKRAKKHIARASR